MEEHKISVIIPVYNVEKYLPRCLDSVIGNSYNNLEIICVDDGSTDKSNDVLKRYKEDGRIIIVAQENGGLPAARNAGLEIATGEFISFVDSDDYIHPKFFETLMKFQLKTDADVVACTHQVTTNDLPEYQKYDNIREEYSLFNYDQFINHAHSEFKTFVWGRIYKRTIINSNRFFVGLKTAEDVAFNMDVLSKKDDPLFCAINEPLYYYYRRADSISHTVSPSNLIAVPRDVYLKNLDCYGSRRALVLEQTLRTILSARYLSRYEKDRCKDRYNECDQLLRYALKEYKKEGTRQYYLYSAFAFFPGLYRAFRIITDPTLLQWEKDQK